MDILLTQDQEQITAAVAEVLVDRFPLSRLHTADAGNGDRSAWETMAELGWFGLGLAEADGGVGFSLAEEMLLLRELGRALASPNVLAAMLGARIAAKAGLAGLAQEILSGQCRPALGMFQGTLDPDGRTEGTVYILDGADSTYTVLWNEQHAALVESAQCLGRHPVAALDGTVGLEKGRLEGCSFEAVIPACADPVALRATVLLAAALVGNAEAVRDMAVEYVKIRQQFGQPIGAFQAIKHRCADMAIGCEAAWCQTVVAAIAARDGRPDAQQQAAAAKLLALRAALANGAANIQIHGAMGFSAECNAHHFLKRAHLLEHIGAAPRQLEQTLLKVQA